MDLTLTPEQEMVRDTYRAFFTRQCPTEVVRKSEPTGFSKSVWDQLVQMGAPGMATSLERGGSGASMLDLGLVAEQAGAVMAPVPLVEHLVTLRLLERLAHIPEDVVSSAAQGSPVLTLALYPAEDVSKLTPAGAVAGGAVVRTSRKLVLVTPDQAWTPIANLASMPLANVPVDGGSRTLGQSSQDLAQHDRAVDEWRILTAASLVGLAESALRLGVEYVQTRRQFGAAIGSFQAVAHGLAEVSGPLSGARLLALKAAWACDLGHHRTAELARMAFALASEVAEQVTYRCLHYHGGYGVMNEYDIQLFYRRARGWGHVLHDAERELLALGDLLYPVREKVPS